MEDNSTNNSTVGRVVRVHLACRAHLPIGSSLRVTGSHLWDPSESGSASDMSGARRVVAITGRDAYTAGDSGFAGGSLGIGAPNVVNEVEAAASGEGTMTPMGRNVASPENALIGVHDSHAPYYVSSVEMVTSPDTYPIWRTRRPVVLVLTDKKSKRESVDDMDDDDDDDDNDSTVFHHNYRYLVVTPGSETDSAHGLGRFDSDSDMDDINNLLNKTKISSGSLSALNNFPLTSNDNGGAEFPVALWENPFLSEQADDDVMEDSTREMSTYSASGSSFGALTASVMGNSQRGKRQIVLEDLPYRTLNIDINTASFVRSENMDKDTLEFTDDGVIIDNWNGHNDVTFDAYRLREGLRKAYQERATDIAADGDSDMVIDTQKPRKRIFIVCYHLPVIVSKDPETGEWMACWAESILARTANSAFVSSFDPHWVGTCTTSSPIENEVDRQALRTLLASMDCTVLFFDEKVRDAHYKGFCKQVLWMVFHHVDLLDSRDPAFGMDFNATSTEKYTDGTLLDLESPWDQRQIVKWWEAFNLVNRTFAVEVTKMVQPDDVVWVHDYHLSLLPRMMSEEEAKIGSRLTKKIFYLHIPFPVSMIFKEIEFGATVLEGILHADIVGFHGFTDARHFLSSAKRILGLSHDSLEGGLLGVKYKGRTVVVTMSSVSVEPEMVDAVMDFPTTISGAADLKSKHSGRAIIAGVDVAQYLSGVSLKLATYGRLLQDSPSWRDKLVLVQRCLIPGARRLDEARTIREIRGIVSQIKSKYGDGVIDYEEVYGSSMPIDQRVALWRAADCLFSADVRGGLNMMPLEFVFAQKGKDSPGIVIASEFSGVFSILNGALRISPYDMKLTLATVDRALTMSKQEREGRHLRDIDFVSSSGSDKWIQGVLRDLFDQTESLGDGEIDSEENRSSEGKSVGAFLATAQEEQFTRLRSKSVISAYKSTSKRVIVLDFNGTIVLKQAVDSYLKRDSAGSTMDAPPTDVINSLRVLCADPKNTVFVVSGDNKENVEQAIGHIPGLGLAASNGSCFSPPLREGSSYRTWLALDLGVDWASVEGVALRIMAKFTARTNGSFIKRAHSSIGWSYYSCDPEFGSLQAKYLVIELERELAAFDVRFVNLKGIVEVIPRKLNKGIIVKKILRDVAARNNNAGVDFVLCMGDDISDEKMFTSVFSFVSEMNEDYSNVVPSPPVIQLSQGTLLASQPFLLEKPVLRCNNQNEQIYAFTVSVGKKESHASQYVDDARDVADLLVELSSGKRASFRRGTEDEMHLMQFS
eukprot:CAMPEP_0113381280 /NCGR_PEP_ID=MMETSP0013_2-20120614/5211_1 /TAXON_ID=2843 ORGANISM="Skeletonema costatum, Strain 1716" /NCGR_SAMPLE_ID=MMETSP0013_2 /ASSEMBLY_ACC=CAM_ASM_000158 /LENGTH=1269 /DNA_ID=CAMNT_0000263683 /DNA_START=8 /DNA_END=3817 /DNA_ORIENTATION=- /assembly_acc=CAM_ASM_000158